MAIEEILKQANKIDFLGHDIYRYIEVTSTNEVARSLAQSGAIHGSVVLSEMQTAGKGRLNRKWTCPRGKGLLTSLIIRPDIPASDVSQFTLLAGVVVAEVLRKVAGCEAGIKWPNDILINEKKVCGILAESSIFRNSLEFVIIGIGLNINLDLSDFPIDCTDTATSLFLETGKRIPLDEVLKVLLETWEQYYINFLKYGFPYLREVWTEKNLTIGRSVTIISGLENIDGTAYGISEKGGLLVKMHNGTIEEFLAGDVTLRKPIKY